MTGLLKLIPSLFGSTNGLLAAVLVVVGGTLFAFDKASDNRVRVELGRAECAAEVGALNDRIHVEALEASSAAGKRVPGSLLDPSTRIEPAGDR